MTLTKEITVDLPTREGEFRLSLYSNDVDSREHLALVTGDIHGRENVLTRIHSECLTGDTLGSLRCDCQDQLQLAMQRLSNEGAGVLIYLRQEGRGIGLLNKLKTYNLQDEGYDTVEANREIGRGDDERSYDIAGSILQDLGVRSVRLMTNNPEKIRGIEKAGIPVAERVPHQIDATDRNRNYLRAKQERLNHLLEISSTPSTAWKSTGVERILHEIRQMLDQHLKNSASDYPARTLSFAQSLDGSIAATAGEQLTISGQQSLELSHGLRAMHDVILIGVGTVTADNPQLTVRLREGENPVPVIVDSNLSIPPDSQVLNDNSRTPIVATTDEAPTASLEKLQKLGVRVEQMPATDDGTVDLAALMRFLKSEGYRHVMVEGGSGIITSCLNRRLVDIMVLTVAPQLLGGFRGIGDLRITDPENPPQLNNIHHRQLGKDLIVWGNVCWNTR